MAPAKHSQQPPLIRRMSRLTCTRPTLGDSFAVTSKNGGTLNYSIPP